MKNNTDLNAVQTAKKMALTPILAAVISSLTYKYISQFDIGLSAEMYTAGLVSALLGLKDILKYKFKLF